MTLRPFALSMAASLCVALFTGCGDDSEPEGTAGNTPPVRPPPAFDCSAHKWMNINDACWSCMCAACSAQLNACELGCTDTFECAREKGTFVNVGTEISCEIEATFVECIASDTARQTAANALIAFDTCLISKGNARPDGFRVCDAECGTPYPGDVCTRYPQ